MFFYIYQITNLVNGKIYVGKHKSDKHPDENGYYGSGKQILMAIKKYGIENFKKEVIYFCSSMEEMSNKEEKIVTKEFIKRKDTYNMHKGGSGGWEHINLNPSKRKEVNAQSSKRVKELKLGGTQHWSNETWKKVRSTSWSELIKLGKFNPDTWANLTEEAKQARRENISTKVTGKNNGSYGTKIYIDEAYIGKLPPSNVLNKQRYKLGEQPKGWIPVTKWRERKKNKKTNAYGRHWYNDSQKNYYLYPTDAKIIELQLTKGRLINKNIIV